MPDFISIEEIDQVFREVEHEVLQLNNAKDIDYYSYHEKRFYRMAKSLAAVLPRGAKVLDIGSHFLHPAMILTKMGYKVYAVDVPVFQEMDFVVDRCSRYQVEAIFESDMASFESIKERKDEFDAVLFTEILEHITFNPVLFWNRVYDAVKPTCFMYLSTPNSLALPSLIRAFFRLVTLKGIGLKVDEIHITETYGHHWKEYSRYEIKKYFQSLSDDFEVTTKYFSFHKGFGSSLRDKLWFGLARLGLYTRVFAPCLESVVKVNKQHGFKMKPPKYL